MKQYLLMGFSTYYPEGGIREIIGIYDSIEEAREACDDEAISQGLRYRCNYQIINLHTLEVHLWGDSEINWKDQREKVYWFEDDRHLAESRRQQKVIGNV